MSFLAKLNIDDTEYNVLECSYGIRQDTYGHGRPSGLPTIEEITLKIESTKGTSFYAWSVSSFEQKDGEIIFYKRDAMASSRILKFTGAFCIGYREDFNNNGKTPMVMNLVLTVDKLECDGEVYTNPAAAQIKV